MSFKDDVINDLDDVFFCDMEFADLHNLNGTEILAVVSINSTKERSGNASRNYDGLHGDFATVSIRQTDIETEPKQGQNFKLDGKLYKVVLCKANMGMLTIELGGYRMGGAG